eukprot:scaffold25830_cov28-Phaeocystis_antarctica.AAC.2
MAAEVIVARPSLTPMLASIASPAWIITRLSMTPKPNIGTASVIACRRSCRRVGTGMGPTVARAAVVLQPRTLRSNNNRAEPQCARFITRRKTEAGRCGFS